MAAYPKAFFIFADGFPADMLRFFVAIPPLYGLLGFGGVSSSVLKVAMSVPFSIALLALRTAVVVRRLPAWTKTQYVGLKRQFQDITPVHAEEIIKERESKVANLHPTLTKGIIWQDPVNKSQTDVVVVFMHGWSGGRLEISPVCERIAKALHANCYFARLPGHGIEMMGFGREEEVTCKGFAYEIAEASVIAQILGKRTLFVGISTGAALCSWFSCQSWIQDSLLGCVCLSTNVWVKPTSVVKIIGRLPIIREIVMFGVRGGWVTRNALRNKAHAEFATTPYPTHLTTSIFDLSSALALEEPTRNMVPTLAFHNPFDPTCSFIEADRFVAKLPNGKMLQVTPPKDEHQHIITGSAVAPSTTSQIEDDIISWANRILSQS